MPELLFEIWGEGPKERGGSMYCVHPQNDKVRVLTEPNAVLIHSFTAKSSFEAFRHNSAWRGYAPWRPPEGLSDHPFTAEEAAEQEAYLARRNLK